jgi:hypothetical protein
MHHFISKYQEKSVTSLDFTSTFESFIKSDVKDQTEQKKILSQLDWNHWIYASGKFPVEFDFTTAQSNISSQLAEDYEAGEGRKSPKGF